VRAAYARHASQFRLASFFSLIINTSGQLPDESIIASFHVMAQ
jgi:hypothetical protein